MGSMASAGGPGPGPGGTFRSLQPVPKPSIIVATVVAGAVGIYAFWELRVRAAQKAGLTPRTISKEWQQAEVEHLNHMNFESNPHKFARLNPFRHNLPHSKSVFME